MQARDPTASWLRVLHPKCNDLPLISPRASRRCVDMTVLHTSTASPACWATATPQARPALCHWQPLLGVSQNAPRNHGLPGSPGATRLLPPSPPPSPPPATAPPPATPSPSAVATKPPLLLLPVLLRMRLEAEQAGSQLLPSGHRRSGPCRPALVRRGSGGGRPVAAPEAASEAA
jgi:hypothetical protein